MSSHCVIRGRFISRMESTKNGSTEDDFANTIDEKTTKEVNAEAMRRLRIYDLDGLERLLNAVTAKIEKSSRTDRKKFKEFRSRIEECIELVEEDIANARKATSNRVASITVGLDESLKHDVDLREFERRVVGLFKWYDEDESNTYMAPYMPVIQSSGSGKTRLFMALREAAKASTDVNYDCMTVLCLPDDVDEVENSEVYFDGTIRLQVRKDKNDNDKNLRRERIRDELQVLLTKSSKDKLVLLFDEAQFLIRDAEGLEFRCIRWWLRENRTTKQVVAVFAGTTSKLANFYFETAPSGFSRDPDVTYVNWKGKTGPTKVYDPFYRICTMGCFQKDAPPDDDLSLLSDFERAAFYGRPLFAYLQKTNKLVDTNDSRQNENGVEITSPRLHSILKRMLLSETTDWKRNPAAFCSILGSRVQLGVTTSFVISSDLVSKAYAHLVHFHADESPDLSNAVARVSFMPDPVCAALAMGLMNDEWTLTLPNGNNDSRITGENKEFWTRQALLLLASGLCLSVKGDSGEIMGALYMLFCGDVLRHAKDRTLRTFSVSLIDWYSKMENTKKVVQPSWGDEISMDINFIQVCRNYFRAHSWKTQDGLELMYKSAIASYVFPDCKAFDIVAPIRIVRGGKTSYHPLLVSVKRYNEMTLSGIRKAFQTTKDLLIEQRGGGTKPRKSKKNNDEAILKLKNLLNGEIDEEGFREEATELLDEIGNEKIKRWETRKEIESKTDPNFEKCPPALCLLVLIGAQDQPNSQSIRSARNDEVEIEGESAEELLDTDTKDEKLYSEINQENAAKLKEEGLEVVELGNFPEEDVFKLIRVPADDQFGISRALRDMTSVHEKSEIFSSHWFIYGEDGNDESRSKVLRGRGKQRKVLPDEIAKFVDSLFTFRSK